MYLKEIGCKGMHYIYLVRQDEVVLSCEFNNESLDSIKVRKFIDWLKRLLAQSQLKQIACMSRNNFFLAFHRTQKYIYLLCKLCMKL